MLSWPDCIQLALYISSDYLNVYIQVINAQLYQIYPTLEIVLPLLSVIQHSWAGAVQSVDCPEALLSPRSRPS
jgi:hypothetical protein